MMKLIYLFLLTMPGTPFIYYGDEIGMKSRDLPSKEGGYTRTGSRTPMQWSDEENAGFSKAKADMLYLPVNDDLNRATVAEQDQNPESLLNRVRELIKLRHSFQALDADAEFKVIYGESGKLPFIYSRFKEGQKLVIALNPSAQSVSVNLPRHMFETSPKVIDSPENAKITQIDSGWTLFLGPVSGAVYNIP
jgi:maltose alpha-D-glucosyltransferase/alpha-amylase